MKQEVIIAILAGFLIGAGVAFGIVQLSSSMKTPIQTATHTIPSPTPETITEVSPSTKPVGDTLTISSPKDESVVSQKTITLSGTAPTGSNIVIETQSDTYVRNTIENGTFSASLTLTEGNNHIVVTGYSPAGTEMTQTWSVVYEPSS